MADAIVSSAVKRLGDLLIQEAEFLYGVSDQVQNIQTELKQMRCFLKDADSKASNGDERVRNRVTQIKDLAYDAEDIIEAHALIVASKRRREGIMNVLKRYACILNEGIALLKVVSEIVAITPKILNLTTSLRTYGIRDLKDGSLSSAHQRPSFYSHVVERYVVGRDESIKELVKNLVDNEKSCRIVSIFGRRFDYLAWLYISQQCKARDVWQEILIELISLSNEEEEILELSDREQAKKLYQVL